MLTQAEEDYLKRFVAFKKSEMLLGSKVNKLDLLRQSLSEDGKSPEEIKSIVSSEESEIESLRISLESKKIYLEDEEQILI